MARHSARWPPCKGRLGQGRAHQLSPAGAQPAPALGGRRGPRPGRRDASRRQVHQAARRPVAGTCTRSSPLFRAARSSPKPQAPSPVQALEAALWLNPKALRTRSSPTQSAGAARRKFFWFARSGLGRCAVWCRRAASPLGTGNLGRTAYVVLSE